MGLSFHMAAFSSGLRGLMFFTCEKKANPFLHIIEYVYLVLFISPG